MVRAVLFLWAVLFFFPVRAEAAEWNYALDSADQPETAWESLRDGLPEELRDELDGVNLSDPVSAAEAVREKTETRFWLERLWEAFSESAESLFPSITPLLSLILIAAAAEASLPAASPALAGAFSDFARLLTALTVFRTTFGLLEAVQEHLNRLCSFMNLMTPVMQAVYLTEGSLSQSAVASSSLMLAVTVLANLNSYLLSPVIRALFTLSAVSSVCSGVKLGGLVSALRKLAMRLWTLLTLFLSFCLGAQTVLAKAADDLAARTAKFALGSFVPVAGGLLSEAFGTIRAGMGLLRLTAGLGGILVLLLLLLPGIAPLAVYRILLSLAGETAELLGLGGTASLLSEVKSIAELLAAVVLCTGLLFLFAVLLFAGGRAA